MSTTIKKKKKSIKSKAKLRTKKSSGPKPIGVVTHYFGNLKVAIVKFNKPIKKGRVLRFLGATSNFKQKVGSIQYNHKDISVAPKGKQVGVKITKKARPGDKIYIEE